MTHTEMPDEAMVPEAAVGECLSVLSTILDFNGPIDRVLDFLVLVKQWRQDEELRPEAVVALVCAAGRAADDVREMSNQIGAAQAKLRRNCPRYARLDAKLGRNLMMAEPA